MKVNGLLEYYEYANALACVLANTIFGGERETITIDREILGTFVYPFALEMSKKDKQIKELVALIEIKNND
jgi:hypothetical protein